MTRDLRNTYKDLFDHLKKDLPKEKEEAFLNEVKNNPEVAEDLESFGAAKVLLEENDLLDFKQAAKGYVKQQKTNKLKVKAATAAVAVVASMATYLYFNQSTEEKTTIDPVKIEQTVDSSKNTPSEVIKEKPTTIKKPAIKENDGKQMEETKKEIAPTSIEKELTKDSVAKNEKEVIKPAEKKKITEDISETNKAKTPVKEILKEEPKKEVKEEIVKEAIAEKEKAESKKQKKNTQNIITNTIEEEFEEENYETTEDVVAEKQDPCTKEKPETFDPEREMEITLVHDPIEDGSVLIYNEYMKEVLKQDFYTGTDLLWDGKDKHSANAPMGLYKVIIMYRNGERCIKDITILRKY